MKPIDQTIVDKDNGDCFRANVASFFDLDITQVPHFILYGKRWGQLFRMFVSFLGYKVALFTDRKKYLDEKYSHHGYFLASVKSKTFGKGTYHSVIIDTKGTVVHDPNPNKFWQGKNIFEEDKNPGWYIIKTKHEVRALFESFGR